MKIRIKSTKWYKAEIEVLVKIVGTDWEKDIRDLNLSMKGHLLNFLKSEKFKGQGGELQSFYTSKLIPAKSVLILGMGKPQDFSLDKLRIWIAKIVKQLNKTHKQNLAIDLNHDYLNKENIQTLAKSVTEGLILGNYRFDKYQTEAKKKTERLEEVHLLTSPSKIQHMVNGVDLGLKYAQATNSARDLVNEPAKITTPAYLAILAKNIAKKEGLGVEVWDDKEVKKKGMEAFWTVAQGSSEPLKFIKLIYKGVGGRQSGRKKITLIGKAVTFDSGGLSLKDSKNMETMKLDMAGAAVILGVFSVLSKIKPKATVVGIIPACENLPGPNAVKPGDIVTAYNGKTIEIVNTDAEGRLTLADALSFAVAEKSDVVIDLATLTGACVVALGEDIAGFFCNNSDLKQKLLISAKDEGEKMWELPLEKDYQSMIKSDIADVKNVGKRGSAGAISAALFLEEFVGSTSWAHIDIAGPAFAEKETSLISKGGSGFGVRTILNYLQNL